MQIRDTGLLEAIAGEHPCGESLEDTQLLASFDSYGLFGRSAPLSAELDWRDIRDRSLAALGKSKDFRLLTHLASAVLRTDGFTAFVETLTVGARWLELWIDAVYPLVDEDGILRRSSLNGFADRMAMVDGVRRAPVLAHRQLGSVSIRDIEIVTGHLIPAEGETGTVSAEQLEGLLAATPAAELRALCDQLNAAGASLKSMEEAVSVRSGAQAAPDFTTLSVPLARTLQRVAEHLATRADAATEATPGAAAPGEAVAVSDVAAVGTVRNRQDATRALDAVAAFFRTNEPSSPIPLLIERAKRLVAKDFLEVLAELAPEALAPAKAASGVRDSDDT
jgi:type VI secretion system protein ImpA